MIQDDRFDNWYTLGGFREASGLVELENIKYVKSLTPL
jgi:hypothetical protein